MGSTARRGCSVDSLPALLPLTERGFPTTMAFTLYRVEADYVIPRSDIVGPGWVCETKELADKLMANLQATRKDLTNFNLVIRHFG